LEWLKHGVNSIQGLKTVSLLNGTAEMQQKRKR